ncbi:MAG: thiamine ABC transporter substrate-binding protein, partial [Halalkalicoccus sp.]|nr:thiamine ABC transporter substrate-binding protein [Halalkalicoccus sp.]
NHHVMNRRRFVGSVGGAVSLGIAGCLSCDGGGNGTNGDGETDDPGTLTVATYESFLDAPSTSPGEWVTEEFERRNPDATIEWTTPDNGLNYYVERASQGVGIDADVYLGLTVDDLIRVDRTLDDALFGSLDPGDLDNGDAIREELTFDPDGRVLPFDTGYISLVYDEGVVDEPRTFDSLLDSAYEGTLLAQNAQSSAPGRAFLLWSIHTLGESAYLDYWRELVDNDVQILGSWQDTYTAYLEEERPMIVSYSTDQVYANRDGLDMDRHRIAFLEEQGYANPEGVALFESTGRRALAERFVDFLLSPEAQGAIATNNVQFPATTHADLGEEFDRYAKEPPEVVSLSYDDLSANLETWVEEWAQEIAQG